MELPCSLCHGGEQLKLRILLLIGLILPVFTLAAQLNGTSEPDLLEMEYRRESLRAMALDEIGSGEYQQALTHLEAALTLAPDDQELVDLKQSVEDLILLMAEPDQINGDEVVEDSEGPDFTTINRPEDEVLTYDFAQELLSEAQRQNPKVLRKAFTVELGVGSGLTQPLYLSSNFVLQDGETVPSHPFSKYSGEVRYYFGENRRNFGLALRYKDLIDNADSVDMLERQLDFTAHYRGFFAETMESRMILGVKGGFGFMGIKEDKDEDGVADGDITTPLVFTGGIYFSDALFRYLFKNSSFFKRFVIEMNFDFIFVTSIENISLSQLSISAGYEFTDNYKISLYSEAFNTATDIQNTNLWEAGFRFKMSF